MIKPADKHPATRSLLRLGSHLLAPLTLRAVAKATFKILRILLFRLSLARQRKSAERAAAQRYSIKMSSVGGSQRAGCGNSCFLVLEHLRASAQRSFIYLHFRRVARKPFIDKGSRGACPQAPCPRGSPRGRRGMSYPRGFPGIPFEALKNSGSTLPKDKAASRRQYE